MSVKPSSNPVDTTPGPVLPESPYGVPWETCSILTLAVGGEVYSETVGPDGEQAALQRLVARANGKAGVQS